MEVILIEAGFMPGPGAFPYTADTQILYCIRLQRPPAESAIVNMKTCMKSRCA